MSEPKPFALRGLPGIKEKDWVCVERLAHELISIIRLVSAGITVNLMAVSLCLAQRGIHGGVAPTVLVGDGGGTAFSGGMPGASSSHSPIFWMASPPHGRRYSPTLTER